MMNLFRLVEKILSTDDTNICAPAQKDHQQLTFSNALRFLITEHASWKVACSSNVP